MRVIKITDHRADGSESFTIYLEDPTNDEVYEYLRGNRGTTVESLSGKKLKEYTNNPLWKIEPE